MLPERGAGADAAQADNLDRCTQHDGASPVAAPVLFAKVDQELLDRRPIERSIGQPDGDLPHLPLEPQLGLDPKRSVLDRDAVSGQILVRGETQLRSGSIEDPASTGIGRSMAFSRSRRTSAVEAPKADNTDASSGTSTWGTPMASAMLGVNNPPHPPKLNKALVRGSRPPLAKRDRTALIIPAKATWRIPQAVSNPSRPKFCAQCLAHRERCALVEVHVAAEEPARVEIAQDHQCISDRGSEPPARSTPDQAPPRPNEAPPATSRGVGPSHLPTPRTDRLHIHQ